MLNNSPLPLNLCLLSAVLCLYSVCTLLFPCPPFVLRELLFVWVQFGSPGLSSPIVIVIAGPLRQWWLAQSSRGYAIKLRFNAALTDEQRPIYQVLVFVRVQTYPSMESECVGQDMGSFEIRRQLEYMLGPDNMISIILPK